MPLPVQTWRDIHARFDHKRRLEYEDQALFVERPGSVAELIATDLQLGLNRDAKWVVCGSIGSGKSSELVHLAARLQGTRLVVGLDLPRSVDRVDLLQPAEILFLIGAAALKLRREIDLSPSSECKQAEKQLTEALQGVLKDYKVSPGDALQGVALFAASLGLPAGAAVGAAAGAARAAAALLPERVSPLGGATRRLDEQGQDLGRLRLAVNQALALLRSVDGQTGPVILVDGLDKIGLDPSSGATAIRQLFIESTVLTMPEAPIIYTAPVSLLLSAYWVVVSARFESARLGNIVIADPHLDFVCISPEKLQQGRALLRQVVTRRLDALHLAEEQVFAAGALDPLLSASGGLLRDLIHLVGRAVRRTLTTRKTQIDGEVAETAIEELRKEYEIALNTRRVAELKHVRASGLSSGDEALSHELLVTNFILPYTNGRIWFAPHAILHDLRPDL